MLSAAPERDVCLLHEDDSDQSAHPCPSPMIDGGDDDLEDLVALSRQEALEAFECDKLDTSATTSQHLRATFRSDVQIEPPTEVSGNSEFPSTSGDTQKVAGKFAVRGVTKLIVAAGQQTDNGRDTPERCR